MGNHGYIVDFYVRCQKTTIIDAADPIIATKYTACHHDKDGKIEYWQGVPKAQEMRHASPCMHEKEVQRISRAFGSCLRDCRSQFHKVSILTFRLSPSTMVGVVT
jgi:hypothetical protein